MAIQFTTSLPEDRRLHVHNKNVTEFSSDLLGIPVYAIIKYLGLEFQILPDVNNSFYYSFDNIRDLIQNNNFADDIEPDITNTLSSLVYNDSMNNYIRLEVEFLVYFSEQTQDIVAKTYVFTNSVQQLEELSAQNTFNTDRVQILLPFKGLSIVNHYANLWNGYPFDIAFYSKNLEVFDIENKTTYQTRSITPKGRINRLFLSDGSETIQNQDIIPIVDGRNELSFQFEDQIATLILNKIDSCGHYFKFKNSKGAWSYWLFNPWSERKRGHDQIANKNNNFSNLQDTRSLSVSLGRESDDELQVIAENLSNYDRYVLNDILDSPKIYYFTGERFSRANASNWLEVELKPGSEKIIDFKKGITEMALTFIMPKRFTMK